MVLEEAILDVNHHLRRKNLVQEEIRSKIIKNKNDPEYNCKDCDFQCNERSQLRKHIALKHTVSSPNGNVECRNCGEMFKTKWHLMNHRKVEHISSVAYCRNYTKGTCTFSGDYCWWKHEEQKTEQIIGCFVCGENFESKSEMMIHRKNKHTRIVKPCTKNEEMNCMFNDKSCWFLHENEDIEKDDTDNRPDEEKDESNDGVSQVFRTAPKKKEPPIKTQ